MSRLLAQVSRSHDYENLSLFNQVGIVRMHIFRYGWLYLEHLDVEASGQSFSFT